jgi:outer membrane protein TolC
MKSMGTGEDNAGSSGSNQSSSSMKSSTMISSQRTTGLTDIYQIQIEEGELENNIALLRNQQSTISALFNSYLNRPVAAEVYTNESIASDTIAVSLISVSDSLLANNPMLIMVNYEKQSIEARKKMVTRMGYPMIGLGLNYSLINKSGSMAESSMNGKDMMMPMVTVTLPVYRKKYTAMRNEAVLMDDAAAQNYQAISNSLQVEYYQAVQLYQDARRRIRLYDTQYNLASRSLDLLIKSFSSSEADLEDVLRVQQQTLDYELKKIGAIADLNTASAWLKRLGSF